jgi:peptidoglycan hydrolase-like protein with peptidoglycan-binding domain
MDSQTVRQVQQALADKGHDPGPVDGMMGPRTRAALQAYQRSQNLTGSSGLDQRTLESLGVQASAAGTSNNASSNPTGVGAGGTARSSTDSGSSGMGGGAGTPGSSSDMNRGSTQNRSDMPGGSPSGAPSSGGGMSR